MQITLKDIAKKTGVSVTAVSKVLNNRYIRIGKNKRDEIEKSAKELGYTPNIIALGLFSKATKSVGIILPEINTLFYPEISYYIEIQLAKNGYQTIICSSEDNANYEKKHIENLLARQVDALIVIPEKTNKNYEVFKSICSKHIPIVFVDRYFGQDLPSYVVTDNYLSVRNGVSKILNGKIANIFYVGGKNRTYVLDERINGLKDEAKENGFQLGNENIYFTDFGRENIYNTCLTIFKRGISNSLIFLESNRIVMGLLDAAYQFNFSIPDDIQIIGFDVFNPNLVTAQDFKVLKKITKPFPVIKQPIKKIADTAATYILEQLSCKNKETIHTKLLAEVIMGENNSFVL